MKLRERVSLVYVLAIVAAALSGCGDDDDGASGARLNPSGVGNYCEDDTDCETGECYLGPGGGYCTTPCDNEGSVDECPVDTVCKPIQGGARRCLLICGSESSCVGLAPENCAEAYCPDRSSCVSVDGTEHRACEPDPG